MNPPMNWVPVILVCWVLACFVFVVWFCVLFGFVLCVFAVCLVYDDDGPMDYVQVLPQFSFAALNSRWPGTLICNYCSCNVIQCGKRPGESHEGVGRKKNFCGLHTWCHVLGVPDAHQLQAQIILRAKKVLEYCPITPAHRKPPWPGYVQGIRLFNKLLVAHPLVGVCLPPDALPAEDLKLAGYMVGSLFLRGHSAGSYAGMVWETILAEFPSIEGRTVLAAIAMPPSLLTRSTLSYSRQVHLIHHADDRLCVWTPSHQDVKLLQQQRLLVTHITGWRAYLGTAQHNYAHWTRATLPEG